MNLLSKNATMSSVEIAELSGKLHKDVLKAIRKMEPAWLNVKGRKFALNEYKDSRGRKLPMFELNKTECLFIATKFNDEARAKLVLRWEELETNKLQEHTKGLPGKRKHNRLTPERLLSIMVDVTKIKDDELRESITNKLMGGLE